LFGTGFPLTVTRMVAAALLGHVVIAHGAFAQPATDAQVEGTHSQGSLQWKPHRQATTATAPPATESDPGDAEPLPARASSVGGGDTADTAPPASVGLPDRVPEIMPLPVRPRSPETAPYAPLRGSLARGVQQMGDWLATTGDAGPATAAGNPNTSFPERFMRTPQGQSGRPILDRDTGYGMTDARPAQRVGGGLAPRYQAGSAAPRQRNERIAMNVDGIPSVMTRGPQAATIDAPRGPGRLPSEASPPVGTLPAPSAENVDPPIIIETTPMDMGMGMDDGSGLSMPGAGDGMWMGQYPAELHVESFYDDPYACDEEGGVLPLHCCDGRLCRWLRQFGKPYYGWKWYRDFTASAGVTAFQNESNFGLLGNYGTNEYLNWAMPFWNAFGVGWQLGARGVQTNFDRVTISSDGEAPFRNNVRDQVFVTTGFFTRAFEGRGLQGGAVYDYLSDSYFDDVDVSQIRGELSYVWGYHEFGFWGAFNIGEQSSIFGPVTRSPGEASTEDLYTGFYRLTFGDANEWRLWGGATGSQCGIVGSSMRAPMSRSLALEGTFTYLIPGRSEHYELTPGTTITASPSAWNVSLNIVYYPARRARRSLASPYRPLFDVADNGSMIRTLNR
jgi:hypothetical protein